MSPILDSKTTPRKQPKKTHKDKLLVGGGFKDLLFSPLLTVGNGRQFDFLRICLNQMDWWVQPPRRHPKIPSNCPGIGRPYCLRSLPGFTSSWLNSFSVGRSVCLVRGLDTSWSVCLVCYVCVWDFMYVYIYIYIYHIFFTYIIATIIYGSRFAYLCTCLFYWFVIIYCIFHCVAPACQIATKGTV